jgi:hypothetical protein
MTPARDRGDGARAAQFRMIERRSKTVSVIRFA